MLKKYIVFFTVFAYAQLTLAIPVSRWQDAKPSDVETAMEGLEQAYFHYLQAFADSTSRELEGNIEKNRMMMVACLTAAIDAGGMGLYGTLNAILRSSDKTLQTWYNEALAGKRSALFFLLSYDFNQRSSYGKEIRLVRTIFQDVRILEALIALIKNGDNEALDVLGAFLCKVQKNQHPNFPGFIEVARPYVQHQDSPFYEWLHPHLSGQSGLIYDLAVLGHAAAQAYIVTLIAKCGSPHAQDWLGYAAFQLKWVAAQDALSTLYARGEYLHIKFNPTQYARDQESGLLKLALDTKCTTAGSMWATCVTENRFMVRDAHQCYILLREHRDCPGVNQQIAHRLHTGGLRVLEAQEARVASLLEVEAARYHNDSAVGELAEMIHNKESNYRESSRDNMLTELFALSRKYPDNDSARTYFFTVNTQGKPDILLVVKLIVLRKDKTALKIILEYLKEHYKDENLYESRRSVIVAIFNAIKNN